MSTRNIGFRFKSDTAGREEIRRDLGQIGQSGQAAGEQLAAGFEAAGRASERLGGYTEAQMERFRKMAQQARQFQTEQERAEASQLKFNAALGVGGGSGLKASDFLTADEVATGRGKLTRQQKAGLTNLGRQGADIFTGVIGGQSPGMIAAQQGPQILDALTTSGLKASAAMVAVGVGVTGVATALIALAAAQASYEASTLKLEVAARGLGAASGQTAAQLEDQAIAGAEAGEISVKSARDMAVAYANTGRIGGGVMSDLIALTERYALTTGQDAASATKELGSAFADPVKGAGDLNDKLHFLDAAEQRHIENLARAGHEAEAQTILVDKLQGSLLNAADATTGWGHALDELGTKASNAFDKVGRVVDRIVTGGSDIDHLNDARAAMRRLSGGGAMGASLRAPLQAEIDGLYRKFVAEQDALRAASLNQRSTDRQSLVDKYNPNDAKLAGLKADREKLLGLGVNDAASKAALKELDDQIKALGAGYKTAAQQAAALARAQRHAAAEAAKDARERAKAVREEAEAQRKAQDLKTQGLRGELEIAKALNDPSAIDYAERQLRIQELTVQATRDGMPIAIAWKDAQVQVSREMQAEFEALRKSYSDAQLAKDQFLTSSERLARAEPGKDFIPYTAKTAFLEELRVDTGQSFHDGLVSGLTRGNFFEAFTDRLKYAAATALADGLTNNLFGKKDGSGSKAGLLTSAFNFISSKIGGHAAGTESAPDGWAWVGEEGPELRKLRAGDVIRSNSASMAMVRQAGAQAAAGGLTVHATFAPVLTIGDGADAAAVGRLEARLDAMQAGFKENVIGAVNDGLARRQIAGVR